MLTRSAAVLNLLPCQFTSLLAGVIGDIKLPLGYDIQIPIISPSRPFIFLAGSPLMTHPNTHTLMSINLKWCGWIGGHSEIGAGHCSGKIDSRIRIWLGGNSRFKYPEMYDCDFGVDVEGWSGGRIERVICVDL